MSFNLSQSGINEQRRIQDSLFWERRQQEAEREELAKRARREGEEEARRLARKPSVYYCTNLKCLVKIKPISEEVKSDEVESEEAKSEAKSEEKHFSNQYQCPNCNEIFTRDWTSVKSNNGLEATSDKDELKRLEDYREKYLHDARELRKKLQFLDEWENR